MGTVFVRLRDLVLTVGCAAAMSIAAILLLGRWKFTTLFETALGGKTLLWAALALSVAIGCAVGFVLGKPPCDSRDGGV